MAHAWEREAGEPVAWVFELASGRNKTTGEFEGTAAIRKCLDDDAVQASQFRRYTRLSADGLVAANESAPAGCEA